MFQQMTIVGNLGGDPEMRYFEDGTAVTNFSVATNRKWKNQATGELDEETMWFRVSAFGAQAENCNKYLKKGRQVLVQGRMTGESSTGGPRLWTAQDGTVRASFEIRAFTVQFLGGAGEEGGGNGGQVAPGTRAAVEEDEIPF